MTKPDAVQHVKSVDISPEAVDVSPAGTAQALRDWYDAEAIHDNKLTDYRAVLLMRAVHTINDLQQSLTASESRLADALENANFAHLALKSETAAYRAFQDAARKLDVFIGDLTAEQCAALPEGMADAWSEFEDAIPCRDCGAAPCGCPNV